MGNYDSLIACIGSVRPKQNKHIYITARHYMMTKKKNMSAAAVNATK